jgi:predicted ATPase
MKDRISWLVTKHCLKRNEGKRGIALLRDQGVGFMAPLLGTLLARTEARAGSFDDALAILQPQLLAIDCTGERWFEAEMHRWHGELLLRHKSPDIEGAESALKRAIEVARIQQTRAFEIRAALALANAV